MNQELRNRRGTFSISMALLTEAPTDVLCTLFANIIVTDVQPNAMNDAMDYVAVSPLFDEVAADAATPVYTAEMVSKSFIGVQVARWSRRA